MAMRERWPRTGKHKPMLLLRADGVEVSASTVGRGLKPARDRLVLHEPITPPGAHCNRMCWTSKSD